MSNKLIGLLLLISAIGAVVTIGISMSMTTDTEELPNDNIPPSTTPTPIPSPTGTHVITTLHAETPENLFVEALTCTNITEGGYVVDLRLNNSDADTKKEVTIYPEGRTVELLPHQIKRVDVFLPEIISTLKLVSSEIEGDIEVSVPTCVMRGGSGGNVNLETKQLPKTSNPSTEIPEFPTIVLPLLTAVGLLFIIRMKSN